MRIPFLDYITPRIFTKIRRVHRLKASRTITNPTVVNINVTIYLSLLNNLIVTAARLHYTQASFNQQISCSFIDLQHCNTGSHIYYTSTL